MSTLERVNSWAQKSCTKWNKNRLSRIFFRRRYRKVAKKYWKSPDHRRLIARYQEGARYINTYPWPYKDPGFANWEENDPAIFTKCTSAWHDIPGRHITMTYGDYYFIEAVNKLRGDDMLFWYPNR